MTTIPEGIRTDPLPSRLLQKLSAIQSADAVPYLTLFLAIVFGFQVWLFQLTIHLACCTLLFPNAARTPGLWGVVAGVATISLLQERDLADNHKFLLCYWLWVMCLAHIPRDAEFRDRIIRFNARFFLIFIFLGAPRRNSCPQPTCRAQCLGCNCFSMGVFRPSPIWLESIPR